MTKRLAILGSTGSIGRSTLDVVRHYPGRFRVEALAAHSNTELLAAQIKEFKPEVVAVADEKAAGDLAAREPGIPVLSGPDGLEELGARPVDVAVCAIVGAAGLKPVLRAIDAGSRVALANKEPLVMAGPLITVRARERGVDLVPVDSEHNAIFQCLQGHSVADVECIHLTASGGPFYGRSRDSLASVGPVEAASHPTWDMGVKISVDSATLMNKGLEVIEAMWLFGLPADKIQVVIHPQSIVHSLVEFTDGSILAHLGITDMKFPILFALTWPDRVDSAMGRLDLTRMRELTFHEPDFTDFPCLKCAFDAARKGGTVPAALNAANEAAVQAFRNHQISFLQISEVVCAVTEAAPVHDSLTLDAVLEADAQAREHAARLIQTLGV